MLSILSARRIKGEEFKVVKDMELRIIDGCDGSVCNYDTCDITLSISVQLLIPYGYKHITIQGEIIMIIVISSSGIIIMIIVISSSGIIIMIIIIMCMYVGMGSQGPQQVVVAVKFGVAFLLLSFLPWLKVLLHSTGCREP